MLKLFLFGVYEKLIDRESAFEILSHKENLLCEARQRAEEEKERIRQQKEAQKALLEAERAKRAEERQPKADQGFLEDLMDQVGKSARRQISNEIGRTIPRSIFGAFFGKR